MRCIADAGANFDERPAGSADPALLPFDCRLKPDVFRPNPQTAAGLLAAAGVVLRVWQYLANSSLWLDEAAVARNILDRSFLALFQPLDYAQVAPPGFLIIEKGIVALLGSSEYALRLFPLICGLSAIFLFWRIAAWTLTGWATPYAVGLFALGTPAVYFSSQVKQYSCDMAATVAVLLVAISFGRSSTGAGTAVQVRSTARLGRASIVALVGAVAVWFSQPAVFVLIGTGTALLLAPPSKGTPRDWRGLLIVGLAWTASVGLVVTLGLRNVSPADRGYLDWYWSGGFMPVPPHSLGDLRWVWERFTWLFGAFATGLRRTNGGLGYPWSQVFVLLFVIGCVALWRRQRDVALLLLLPVLVALTAAALHLYPFTGRVLSFLLPIFLLATAAGVAHVLGSWPDRLPFVAPALLAVAVGSPVYAMLAALPPERIEHLRPVMERVAERRQPADVIYVYYAAGQPFQYYASRFGLKSDAVTLGRCSATDLRAYLRDLDQFREHRRVWIVATHARRGASELLTMIGYLDAIGRRLDAIEVRATSNLPSNGAYAFLYDLSDEARLRSVSAETYTVPAVPDDPGFAKWGCYGTRSAVAR